MGLREIGCNGMDWICWDENIGSVESSFECGN
jgi:hypothetical protein